MVKLFAPDFSVMRMGRVWHMPAKSLRAHWMPSVCFAPRALKSEASKSSRKLARRAWVFLSFRLALLTLILMLSKLLIID